MRNVINTFARNFGYEIKRLAQADASNERGKGTIRHCVLDGIDADFFVTDLQDSIQEEHLAGRFYEPDELRLMMTFFTGGVFVDVGSNVGNHAIFFGKQPNCTKVIAFEPNPVARTNLFVNIGLNGLSDKIVVHDVGLGDQASSGVLSISKGNLGGATFLAKPDRSTETLVGTAAAEIRVGDELLGEERISFLKIDAEGFEEKVIKGLVQTIKVSRPVIFVETGAKTRQGVEDLLAELGYRVEREFSRYEGLVNLLAVPGGE